MLMIKTTIFSFCFLLCVVFGMVAEAVDLKPLLYPYQQRWVNDKSRRKIAKKGRQIGFSWATMLEIVDDCLDEAENGDWLVLSAGERQAKQLCKILIKWIHAYDEALSCLVGGETDTPWTESEVYCPSIAEKVTVLDVVFRNGKTVTFVPANPDTVRGYSRNVAADEYAFHKNQTEILRAIAPSISRNQYRLLVWSTTNGKSGAFYEIWTGDNDWSKHDIPLKLAIAEGCPIDYEEMCDALNNDPDSIAQELDAEFLDTAGQFLSPELISFAESDKAALPIMFEGWQGPEDEREGELLSEARGKGRIRGDLFLGDFLAIENIINELSGDVYSGYDVGRKRHFSVLWSNERVDGDYLKADLPAAIVGLSRVSFDSQEEVLRLICLKSRRTCIDKTGIGMQLAETMEREFAGRAEGIDFTLASKEDMAWRVRNKMSDTTAKTPVDATIRASLKTIKKKPSTGGHDRFDAETTETTGHGDHFWALALSLLAGSKPVEKIGYTSVLKRKLTAYFRGDDKRDERRPPKGRDARARRGRWDSL